MIEEIGVQWTPRIIVVQKNQKHWLKLEWGMSSGIKWVLIIGKVEDLNISFR